MNAAPRLCRLLDDFFCEPCLSLFCSLTNARCKATTLRPRTRVPSVASGLRGTGMAAGCRATGARLSFDGTMIN
jgi:hypothetical protein